MSSTCLALPIEVTVDDPDFTRTAAVELNYSTEILLNNIPAGKYQISFTWTASAAVYTATANDGVVQLHNPGGTLTLGASAVGSGASAVINYSENAGWTGTNDGASVPCRWDLINASGRTETFSMIVTVGSDGRVRLTVDARLNLTAIQAALGTGSQRIAPVYLDNTFRINSVRLVPMS